VDDREAVKTAEPPVSATSLNIKVFADGADLNEISQLYANPVIAGFTTNPTLMHRAGITDYERFAQELLEVVPDRPISFEVFSDEPADMERQARRIASWGEHVYVKIPVTYTSGERAERLILRLCDAGIKVNVTGLTSVAQVEWVAEAIAQAPAAYVSVFAGRIADTGVDPVPVMRASLAVLAAVPNSQLIWASPRELLNIVQADQIGCHIITVTHDLLKKLPLLGRDLAEYSLETVRMFHRDAEAAGFEL
jgi:transaldolase